MSHTFINEKLAPSSIKTYLAAITHEQISLGLGNPQIAQISQLEYVVKGVKMLAKQGTHKRLDYPDDPLTVENGLGKRGRQKRHENAVGTLLFVFLWRLNLRLGEMVAPTKRHFDPQVHLRFGDIKVYDQKNPTYLQVLLKASKTDPYRQEVQLYISATNADLCPVTAVVSFMVDCLSDKMVNI